jgi:hypothetical protein
VDTLAELASRYHVTTRRSAIVELQKGVCISFAMTLVKGLRLSPPRLCPMQRTHGTSQWAPPPPPRDAWLTHLQRGHVKVNCVSRVRWRAVAR